MLINTSTEFSCTVGPTLEAAAAALPHGQIRFTTVGAVRAAGGIVKWEKEFSRYGTINLQHVNVMSPTDSMFSALMPNPVLLRFRIDGARKRGSSP